MTDPQSPLEYALAYAARGWPVLPLHTIQQGKCTCKDPRCEKSAGKHPIFALAPNGLQSASADVSRIRDWWGRMPDANIGIVTGAASGFTVLDIDPRNGGDDALAALEKTHGKLPDTPIQLTGGGGLHYLFRVNNRRLKSPGKGIDAKDNGGYIVAAPSLHMSGGKYQWEGSADPLDGAEFAEAPEWLLESDFLGGVRVRGQSSSDGFIHPQRAADLRAALKHLDASSYETWIRVGQALHATEAPEAFEIWDEWSKTASNYDGTTGKKWGTFSPGGGLNVESVFVWARNEGWGGETELVPVPIEAVVVKLTDKDTETPPHLLSVPGVLGDFVRWTNSTAPKPQPQFSVQAALALGSVVAGRRWKSTKNNFTSLYLLNVGKSASGKEHARTAIERVMTAAKLEKLLGPSGYTSDSAVISALLTQPAHLAVIDEFGAMLGNAKAQGNFHKRQSLDILIQAWGLLHGTMRAQGYSTMGLTKAQREAQDSKKIECPAISILGMTTPRTFYQSLTDQAIEGGFLNRLMVVESFIGPQVRGHVDPSDPPASVVQWCESVASASSGDGNLARFDLGPESNPMPRTVPFSSRAEAQYKAYEVETIGRLEKLESEGLDELEGRSVEKAMRVGLILAISKNPSNPVIDEVCAQWSIDYVRHYTKQTIDAVRSNMHSSQFGEWRAEVMRLIEKAKAKGVTERELSMYSRVFAGLDKRQRRAIFDALESEQRIALVDLGKGQSGRGKSRIAWVALADSEADYHDAA